VKRFHNWNISWSRTHCQNGCKKQLFFKKHGSEKKQSGHVKITR